MQVTVGRLVVDLLLDEGDNVIVTLDRGCDDHLGYGLGVVAGSSKDDDQALLLLLLRKRVKLNVTSLN